MMGLWCQPTEQNPGAGAWRDRQPNPHYGSGMRLGLRLRGMTPNHDR